MKIPRREGKEVVKKLEEGNEDGITGRPDRIEVGQNKIGYRIDMSSGDKARIKKRAKEQTGEQEKKKRSPSLEKPQPPLDAGSCFGFRHFPPHCSLKRPPSSRFGE